MMSSPILPLGTNPNAMTLSSYLEKLREQSGQEHSVDVGKRWFKIHKGAGAGSRSVVAFVDALTGRVHQAKSWKQPGRPLSVVLEMGLPPGTVRG
jgi:hypothetical protein